MFKNMLSAKLSDVELAPVNELKTLYGYPEVNTLTFREFVNMAVSELLAYKKANATPHDVFINNMQPDPAPAPTPEPEPAPEPAPAAANGLIVPFSPGELFFIDAMKRPFERRNKTEVSREHFVYSIINGLIRYGKVHSEVVFTQKEIREKEREFTA